jgi:hypothetical protein
VPVLFYGPPNVRLIRPKRLPQGIRDAGVALVERKLSNSTVSDLVSISDDDWHVACRRFNATLSPVVFPKVLVYFSPPCDTSIDSWQH